MSRSPQNRSSRPVSAASALLGMVVVAVVAGVMVTVAVAPAVALTGVTAARTVGLFEDLPSDLKLVALDQKTELYAKSKGKNVQIASFYTQDREVIGWKDVPAVVRNAAVAGEDARFYEHGGVDPTGIARAIVADASGKDIQGASTITQQLVKNVCVQEAERLSTKKKIEAAYDDCTDDTIGRKLREMRYAIGLEKKYSKNEILLDYLNIAGFGGSIYGIQAASEYYYGEPAKDLSLAKAASLIAIVNNPSHLRLDEKANLKANTARRNYILASELKQGMITRAVYDKTVKLKEKPKITPTNVGCAAAGVSAYFCEYVVDTIENDKAFGKTQDDRIDALTESGWKIYTTLNLDLEKSAKKVMSTYVPKTNDLFKIGGAAVTTEVGTGRILSMVQNTDYTYNNDAGDTQVNYSANYDEGGSGGFQPGSSYKIFTLLDWLKTGHTLNDQVEASERTWYPDQFKCDGATLTGDTPYSPENDDVVNGYRTVLDATAESINNAFMSMASQLDLCDIRSIASSFGVKDAYGDKMQAGPSSVIGGASNVSPVTMAAAYAAMGDDGKYCSPIAIDKIVAPAGETAPAAPKATCRQAASSDVVAGANVALHQVLTSGTAAGDTTADGVYEVGKTGTTNEAEYTWLDGTSSKVATSVWIGNVSGHENLREVYNTPYCSVTGSTQAALERHCVWRGIMTAANAIYGGASSFTAASSQYTGGTSGSTTTTTGTVPNVVGLGEQDAINAIIAAGDSYVIGSSQASDQYASGVIAAQSPSAGSASTGGRVTVTITPSSG